MGRQHRHDRMETVEKAMNLFWRSGFSGTSLRDLEACLDMRPGSIYRRFGNKEHLYDEAMAFYAAKTHALFQSHMDEAAEFMTGLRQFIHQLLAARDSPRCCLLAKTIVEATPEHDRLKQTASGMIANFENSLVIQLETARQSGEINHDCDLPALARFIQVQIIGIRSYAEMGQHDRVIPALLDDIMTAIAAKANTVG
ncbi:MAG: TetR/AcrR family transcriptional regulator [Alphaproteobacteria bacterium]|nr:TetR/AcrR family transcriptional regulator [Alphaproteobacteria bacterium]